MRSMNSWLASVSMVWAMGCATVWQKPRTNEPLDETIFEHVATVRNAARVSVRFEAGDVNVEGVSYKNWQLAAHIDGALGTYRVEEVGDRRTIGDDLLRVAAECGIGERCLASGEQSRFRLLFFGEPGFMVSPTGRTGDFRLVEPDGETAFVNITLTAESDAGAKLEIGRRRKRAESWSGTYTLTGAKATISERVTFARDGATYAVQKVDPEELKRIVAKVWNLKADISAGRPIQLAADNVLRSGPSLLERILLDLFFPADVEAASKTVAYVYDDVRELQSAQDRFTHSSSPAKNHALDEIYREIVAYKIVKLFYCVFASQYQPQVRAGMMPSQADFLRLVGLPFVQITADAFEECVDSVETMRWALTALPTNCPWVQAHPEFDVSRCDRNSPDTYMNTHVMKYLCFSYDRFSKGVLQEDDTTGARRFVAWMRKHDYESKLLPAIWRKIVNYCHL
jgi:hypothetical protein